MMSSLTRCGVLLLMLSGPVARAEVIPLATQQGRCEFILPTPDPAEEFFLIVGSLADGSTTTKVQVRISPSAGPAFLPLEKTKPDSAWKAQVEAKARFLERARRNRPTLNRFSPLARPPADKIFHLFTGERDLENPAHYQEVRADLVRIGRFGQVYLDGADKGLPGVEQTTADALRIFDEEIVPRAERDLGRALDVDRDGRFTLLFTRKLDGLQNGKVRIDGFVRGSDFFRDLPVPFSNRCDMLYLNANLKPGPHLATILAHEFTHAVTFCEHALTSYQGAPTNQDEESWLNEGIAHLVESLSGFGWSNLEQRIQTYLANPEQYPLVVPDYFEAGLWRNPGTRGATFLFLRSCLAQTDPDLPRRLIQSPLRGKENLEVATEKAFPELFRQACVDLLDTRKMSPWRGLRPQGLRLDGEPAESRIAGTAAAYFLLHTPKANHARVTIEGPGPLQVTLVRGRPSTGRGRPHTGR